MKFKDYYSILEISSHASDEEIRCAYDLKKSELNKGDSVDKEVSCQAEIDIEEAYRVLSSYKLKDAYDELYDTYVSSESKENFTIEDVWLKNEMDDIRTNITNYVKPHPRQKTSWMKGCLWKIVVPFILFTIGHCTVNSHRSVRRHNLEKQLSEYLSEYREGEENPIVNIPTINTSDNSDEARLQKTVSAMNRTLPKVMDENMTLCSIMLTPSDLIYEYEIDDVYFLRKRADILSPALQCMEIEKVYEKMKPLIDVLTATNRRISYAYKCRRSGERLVVTISQEELANLIQNGH